MTSTLFSIIIPARNEAYLIGATLESVLVSVAAMRSAPGVNSGEQDAEILVVDNGSTDQTCDIAAQYLPAGVQLLHARSRGAPCARNLGAQVATGRILVFVDADTHIQPNALARIRELCENQGYQAGMAWLSPLEPGWKARGWWTFWNHVRLLPLARAKALPALMFCTRPVFQEFGPFDESVAIGEEWPILAGLYRVRPHRLIYNRLLVARTSNRRMDLQPFGYARTFIRYLWAIVHVSGRKDYGDHCRHLSTKRAGS